MLDATDEQTLTALGEGAFDAAICNMALFDMAQIAPLLVALARLLAPGAPFVFSVLHPCFNNAACSHLAELTEHDGQIATQYAVKVWQYLTSSTTRAVAMPGQPQPQLPVQAATGVPAAHGSGVAYTQW